jgi:hypothetical protein
MRGCALVALAVVVFFGMLVAGWLLLGAFQWLVGLVAG